MYQNAGEKGRKHLEPDDPPRRRAHKLRGHGTWEQDRPLVVGVVGRTSRQLRLAVCHHSDRLTLEAFLHARTRAGAMVYTDEWHAYNHLPQLGRQHARVHHKVGEREWARDDDGDGVREVHCNTLEGIWTGVRNFLRPFRGIHKAYLDQYLSVFEIGYCCKTVTAHLLRAMMLPCTLKPT
jgi:transposase-like protein